MLCKITRILNKYCWYTSEIFTNQSMFRYILSIKRKWAVHWFDPVDNLHSYCRKRKKNMQKKRNRSQKDKVQIVFIFAIILVTLIIMNQITRINRMTMKCLFATFCTVVYHDCYVTVCKEIDYLIVERCETCFAVRIEVVSNTTGR